MIELQWPTFLWMTPEPLTKSINTRKWDVSPFSEGDSAALLGSFPCWHLRLQYCTSTLMSTKVILTQINVQLSRNRTGSEITLLVLVSISDNNCRLQKESLAKSCGIPNRFPGDSFLFSYRWKWLGMIFNYSNSLALPHFAPRWGPAGKKGLEKASEHM